MRAALSLCALCLGSPVWAADGTVQCRFETLCTGTQPCEPADDDAVSSALISGNIAAVAMGGNETADLILLTTPGENPATYAGAEEGDGGGLMFSLFDDGTAVLTIHGDLFGPFAATAFGTCAEAAE